MSKQKQKGTAFETAVERYLLDVLDAEPGTIGRLALNGEYDEGDIYGVYCRGRRVVVEVKNKKRYDIAGWLGECERERGNADALAGVCVFHRAGLGIDTTEKMGGQPVLMSLDDFIALATGERPTHE